MSIQSEIDRISGNVQDTISAIRQTGVTVPEGANSDNLPSLAAALANEKQDKLTAPPGSLSVLIPAGMRLRSRLQQRPALGQYRPAGK